MSRLLTSAQMQRADQRTIQELGLPGMVLMENAGAAVVASLWERLPDLAARRVVVVAGGGNNGGDGFVVARRLLEPLGGRVVVLLAGSAARLQGDAALNHGVYTRMGGVVEEVAGEEGVTAREGHFRHAGVVVDALFGTGLARPVTGVAAALIRRINACACPVVAVDLPSGVAADTGQLLGEAVRATWTVTFGAEKIAHRQHPGAALCGEVVLAPIGIPRLLLEDPAHQVGRNLPGDWAIPPRPVDGHKGSFGHLLVVAGGVGKAGAAVLTARGAQRIGPGLVTVASPAGVQPTVAAQLTEAMTLPLPAAPDGGVDGGSAAALAAAPVEPGALAVGPGLGGGSGTLELVRGVMARWHRLPVVVDADGLNALALLGGEGLTALVVGHGGAVILTPHPGEMARLLGSGVAAVQADRLGCARAAATRWGAWVVLKGAGSVIAAPDGRAWINHTGNSGLAAGGSGDLLTGIIGGLLAQRWGAESAVRAGVWLHGAAAEAASGETGPAGLLATDLLPHLWRLRNTLG